MRIVSGSIRGASRGALSPAAPGPPRESSDRARPSTAVRPGRIAPVEEGRSARGPWWRCSRTPRGAAARRRLICHVMLTYRFLCPRIPGRSSWRLLPVRNNFRLVPVACTRTRKRNHQPQQNHQYCCSLIHLTTPNTIPIPMQFQEANS